MSYDQGSGNWIILDDAVTDTEYVTENLQADVVYTFRVESRNSVGYSDISETLTVRAAAMPDTPNAPVSTVNGANVDITWDEVYDGGSPLTRFTILIR